MRMRATVGIPQNIVCLQATDSGYHTGSSITNLRITGYTMTNPLTAHKGIRERKP